MCPPFRLSEVTRENTPVESSSIQISQLCYKGRAIAYSAGRVESGYREATGPLTVRFASLGYTPEKICWGKCITNVRREHGLELASVVPLGREVHSKPFPVFGLFFTADADKC